MKSVLISIKPRWCALIASGKKTVEVRKTKPKIETPFKCYIYCTSATDGDPHSVLEIHTSDGKIRRANGKVIGEFLCSGFDEFVPTEKGVSCKKFSALYDTQLSVEEMRAYLKGKTGYGWRISEVLIYEEPKALSEFKHCGANYHHEPPVTRPPQSWNYVRRKDDDR